MSNPSLTVHVLHALKDNFVYILESSGHVAVIDPSESKVVEAFLQERSWPLHQIFCTHHHLDHVGGAAELSRRYSAPVLTSQYDFSRISGASKGLQEGDVIAVGPSFAEVISLPGHTLGHLALHFPKELCAFVGDTLFSAGCGRLFEGTPEQMFGSLKKLGQRLSPDCKIYFGHEYTERNLDFVIENFPSTEATSYWREVQNKRLTHQDTTPTTWQQELKINPFLQAQTAEEFARIRKQRDQY